MPVPRPRPKKKLPSARPVEKVSYAPKYKVFVHNDDKTPMEFVVMILMGIFNLRNRDAGRVMIEAHNSGVAFVTALPFEQAEFRVDQAHSKSRAVGYPLTFSFEKE